MERNVVIAILCFERKIPICGVMDRLTQYCLNVIGGHLQQLSGYLYISLKSEHLFCSYRYNIFNIVKFTNDNTC